MIVLSVVEAGLSMAEAARRLGISWRWVHTLVQRYEAEGLYGLELRSRRPHTNPRATPEPVRIRILELREKLAASGLDADPATIAWHLAGEGIDPPPAISTIRRITAAVLVAPEPRKRPTTNERDRPLARPSRNEQ